MGGEKEREREREREKEQLYNYFQSGVAFSIKADLMQRSGMEHVRQDHMHRIRDLTLQLERECEGRV